MGSGSNRSGVNALGMQEQAGVALASRRRTHVCESHDVLLAGFGVAKRHVDANQTPRAGARATTRMRSEASRQFDSRATRVRGPDHTHSTHRVGNACRSSATPEHAVTLSGDAWSVAKHTLIKSIASSCGT